MIVIQNGRVFIDGIETVNYELIGLAFLDFAESIESDNYKIEFRNEDVFEYPEPVKSICCKRINPENLN